MKVKISMKKYLFVLMLLPMLMMGCEEPEIKNRKPVVRTFENDSIRVKFWLQTSEGENATVFLKGEDIVGRYGIENITNDTIHIDSNIILRKGSGFGKIYTSNNDELIAYRRFFTTCDVKEYAFAPGEYIEGQFKYPDTEYADYGSNCQHLEEGKYYTKYKPLICNTKDWSHMDIPELRIDFKVK